MSAAGYQERQFAKPDRSWDAAVPMFGRFVILTDRNDKDISPCPKSSGASPHSLPPCDDPRSESLHLHQEQNIYPSGKAQVRLARFLITP